MYKHIIWDFDGTLFNTYPAMGKTFKAFLDEEGHDEPLEEILKQMKVSMLNTVKHYQNKYQIDQVFLEKYDKERKEKEVNQSEPFEGIVDVLKYIKESGKSNYIYTHRGESTYSFLEKHNLLDYFKEIITKNNNYERKPSPEGINYLINKYDMKLSETIMIGDRDLDLLSGKNANIDACYFSENGEKNNIADYTIDNYKDLYNIIK